MIGMKQFVNEFGLITISKLTNIILALIFLCVVYTKLKKYISQRILEEQDKAEKMDILLKEIQNIPNYQKELQEIKEYLNARIDETNAEYEQLFASLSEIRAIIDKRDRNKLRDKLLVKYRYYTDLERNPNREWRKMEADSFWELFNDYEEAQGNGDVHSLVYPAMIKLKVIDD